MSIDVAEMYRDEAVMKDYEILLEKFFKSIQASNPAQRAKSVVKFEIAVGESYPSWESVRETYTKNTYQDRKEFISKYPHLKLETLFSKAAISVPVRNVIPEAMAKLNSEIGAASVETIQSVMMWKSIPFDRYFDKSFDDAYRAFRNKHFGDPVDNEPLEKSCVNETSRTVGRSLDFEVFQRKFGIIQEEKVQVLAKKVQQTILSSISSNKWLSDGARNKAELKIKKMRFKLVKPQQEKHWQLEPNVEFSPTHFIKNKRDLLRASEVKFNEELAHPLDAETWHMSPLEVNAYYDPSANNFVLTAGILQPPIFDPAASESENLGAIGTIIGHEIGHAIDDEGSKFDENGKIAEWMNAEDLEKFKSLTAGLVKQFDEAKGNGKFSLGENIGDLVGLKSAFLSAFPTDSVGNVEERRKFFIKNATIWCGVVDPQFRKTLLESDPHAPIDLRVNQQVRHSEGFEKAFSCKAGDPMTLPAAARVKIW